jgi:hypothetical protein
MSTPTPYSRINLAFRALPNVAIRTPTGGQFFALLDPLVAVQAAFEAFKFVFKPFNIGDAPIGNLVEVPNTGGVHLVLKFLSDAPNQRQLIAFAAARCIIKHRPLPKFWRAGEGFDVAVTCR